MPCSSTTNTRSASPSKAKPMSAPTSRTRAHRSRWFSGWSGSAGWFGNRPSSSSYMISRSNGQHLEHRGDHQAAHAVGGVGHHLQRLEDRRCRRTSGRGRRRRRAGRRWCGRPWWRRPGRPVRASSRTSARPESSAHGAGAGQAELDAVVLGRVVRGGEHGAGRVAGAGGEVQEVGGRQAEVDHVDALGADAVAEGVGQLHTRGPHVSRDEDLGHRTPLVEGEVGEGGTDGVATGCVDLIGIGAPNVVRLEDGIEVRHGPATLRRPTSVLPEP